MDYKVLALSFLRIFAIGCGLLCIYIAVFIYETERGEIQNKLENWWIKIDDAKRTSLSRHVVFMRYVAEVSVSMIDRLLGNKFLSLRAVGVAVFCCYAAALFLCSFYLSVAYSGRIWIVTGLPILVMVISGTLPVFVSANIWKVVWGSLIILFLFFWAVGMFLAWELSREPFILTAAYGARDLFDVPFLILGTIGTILGTSLTSFFCLAFIKTIRKLLLWSSGLEKPFQISAAIGLNLLVVTILIGIPFVLLSFTGEVNLIELVFSQVTPGFALRWVLLTLGLLTATSNVIPVVICLDFVFLALVMAVHQTFWPVISRGLYALQGLGIPKRNKLLGSLGAMLIVTGIGKWDWLERIIERLTP